MKISAISTQNPKNFKGTWQDRIIYNRFTGTQKTERIYTPDKNESYKDIAIAWARETGDLPMDWAKENNIYNQQGKKEYHLAGYHYLPLELLKESVKISIENKKPYQTELKDLIELAKLSEQTNDTKTVKQCEKEMQKVMDRELMTRVEIAMIDTINEYKDTLGTQMYYKKHQR